MVDKIITTADNAADRKVTADTTLACTSIPEGTAQATGLRIDSALSLITVDKHDRSNGLPPILQRANMSGSPNIAVT